MSKYPRVKRRLTKLRTSSGRLTKASRRHVKKAPRSRGMDRAEFLELSGPVVIVKPTSDSGASDEVWKAETDSVPGVGE